MIVRLYCTVKVCLEMRGKSNIMTKYALFVYIWMQVTINEAFGGSFSQVTILTSDNTNLK